MDSMERLSDNYYVEKIRLGETDCFAYLLNRYGKQVFSLIVKIVENREDAEELAQDVFVKAYTSLSSFRGESSFSTWIYRIAYNIAVSATRKKTSVFVSADEGMIANMPDEESDDMFATESVNDARISCLNSALELLPPDERAMIMLFYKDNRSMEDIAFITGLSETNVKTKIFRIRKKLFVLIKAMEEENYGN